MKHQAPQVWREHKKLSQEIGSFGVVLSYTELQGGKHLALIQMDSGEKKTLALTSQAKEGQRVELVMRRNSVNQEGLILYTLKAKALT